MTTKECKEMPDDMPVLDLKVTITQIGQFRSGTNETYGDWSFQDLKIKDSVGEMWVKCSNRPKMSQDLKGEKVLLTCNKSDTQGWTGLKTFDDEYEDKITRKLKMTKTGVIQLLEESEELETKKSQTSETKSTESDYWNEKFDLDKERLDFEKTKQTVICREHALTSAIEFINVKQLDTWGKEEIIELAEYFSHWTLTGNELKEKTVKEPF